MSHTQQSTSDNKSILVFCVYSSCFYEGYSEMDLAQSRQMFQIFLIETTFLHYWLLSKMEKMSISA